MTKKRDQLSKDGAKIHNSMIELLFEFYVLFIKKLINQSIIELVSLYFYTLYTIYFHII